jgi:hypothetical protein
LRRAAQQLGFAVTLVTLLRFQAAKHGFLGVTGRVTTITSVTLFRDDGDA